MSQRLAECRSLGRVEQGSLGDSAPGLFFASVGLVVLARARRILLLTAASHGCRIVLIQAHGHRTPEELFSDAPASFPHEIGRPGVPPASLVVAEDDLFYDRCVPSVLAVVASLVRAPSRPSCCSFSSADARGKGELGHSANLAKFSSNHHLALFRHLQVDRHESL